MHREPIDSHLWKVYDMTSTADEATREQVRTRYAAAAVAVTAGQRASCGPEETASSCCSTDASCCGEVAVEVDEGFGAGLYSATEKDEVPAEALAASLGCGNPLAVADLRAGEIVLDLG